MSTTGTLIVWAAICAIYLRFRKACQVQGVQVVEAAKSPLQPFLAYYGLFWTCFFSTCLPISADLDSHLPRISLLCKKQRVLEGVCGFLGLLPWSVRCNRWFHLADYR